MTGRMVCDVKTSVKELMRCRSYDLQTVCSEVFPKMKPEDIPPVFTPEEVVKFYE
jgi:DNA polymerase alpha subunit A